MSDRSILTDFPGICNAGGARLLPGLDCALMTSNFYIKGEYSSALKGSMSLGTKNEQIDL